MFQFGVSWKWTEHQRNQALEKAKQAVFCLAQHISLSFSVVIVMDWLATMRMKLAMLLTAFIWDADLADAFTDFCEITSSANYSPVCEEHGSAQLQGF